MTSALTTAPDPFPPRRDTRLDSVVSYLSAGTNQSSNDFEANATVSGGKDGMRREWNFLLHFQHKAARLSMQMSPQWEIRFIDTEVIEAALRQAEEKPIVVPPSRMSVVDSAAEVSSSSGKRGSETGMAEDTHTEAKVSIPLRCDVFIPFLKYGDMSAFVSESRNTNNNKAGPVEEGKEESSAKAKKAEEDFKTGGIEDKVWLENVEQVEWFYSCIPTEMTLQEYCISCVQFVVKDPQVVSVDGERNLRNLKVGEKMRTWYTIAGHKMFHFYFNSQNKHHLTLDAMFATGTIVNQRGYLFIIRSGDEEDLNNYIQKFFLPYFTKQNRILFDVDVSYRKMISTMLEEQQRHAGELTYQDRDAAVSVSLPLYAMRIRPDYSPVKTVDVGSIACMTFELSVYERLIDDAVVAEITGMPKHKVNKVVLTLDVEDVARMGYPKVMSTEQYSELKTKRILEVYADAKSIGTPTSVPMGDAPVVVASSPSLMNRFTASRKVCFPPRWSATIVSQRCT
ncbi:hypothetical protein AGDE_14425 [Angomonas deanei]|uniref:Uncharacterized protein n=1 Tax=Angomonas deanei TaxID=59799 RepID=A0A7G2CSG0_9TRYP|nr:hypothetical protein AGDE_14425 [Angomonas deanei]CAD2222137.1 hypothetical protein, conserved [Angomonas deanei]|eukprot:EPY20890.1 hypothetical protein AGDE_14425 [Angomonas deanei]